MKKPAAKAKSDTTAKSPVTKDDAKAQDQTNEVEKASEYRRY